MFSVHVTPPTTRATLLERLSRDSSWDELVRLYGSTLVRYVRRLHVPEADVPDIVQETIIGSLTALREGRFKRGQGRFRGWLRTIARNKVGDYFRQRRRSPDRSMGGTQEDTDFLASLPDTGPPQDQMWESEWRATVLAEALQWVRMQSDEKMYRAFELYAMENRPPKEVAKQLGVTVNAVYLAKSRIISLLRWRIDELGDD